MGKTVTVTISDYLTGETYPINLDIPLFHNDAQTIPTVAGDYCIFLEVLYTGIQMVLKLKLKSYQVEMKHHLGLNIQQLKSKHKLLVERKSSKEDHLKEDHLKENHLKERSSKKRSSKRRSSKRKKSLKKKIIYRNRNTRCNVDSF